MKKMWRQTCGREMREATSLVDTTATTTPIEHCDTSDNPAREGESRDSGGGRSVAESVRNDLTAANTIQPERAYAGSAECVVSVAVSVVEAS